MSDGKLAAVKARGKASMDWLRDKLGAERQPFAVVEVGDEPTTVTLKELRSRPKTDTVVVSKRLIARFFLKAAAHPDHEVGGMLHGTIDGRYLRITGMTLRDEPGTKTHISFDLTDYRDARRACDDNEMVAGWIHSHPGHGVFLSRTDRRHQIQCQDLDPDSVALVMDPFQSDGIAFNFFRVTNGEATALPHIFVEEADGTRKTDTNPLVEPDTD